MVIRRVILCTLLLAATAGQGLAAPLAMDVPSRVGNIDLVCTGFAESKDDPRWASYPLRVEFFDARRRWIPGGDVVLSDTAGHRLVGVNCPAPWLLVRLAPGDYIIDATEEGAKPRSAKIHLTAAGQLRAQLIFPEIVNQQEAAPGSKRVMPANDSADFLNGQMKAKNAAIDAKYKAEQDKYQSQLKSYEKEKQKAADAAAQAKAAQAAYARQMADWQAKVKACKSGDRAKCK
ncbi:MAG: hypothetical protein JO256_11495 [Alphaproteobacteria bacterium]|nr:hypothetical protein [Alphaproteobacteria bacterium]